MFDHFFVGDYRCKLDSVAAYVARYSCVSREQTVYAHVPVRMRKTLSADRNDGDTPAIVMALAGRAICTQCSGVEYAPVEPPQRTDYPGSYICAVNCEHCGGDGWEPLPA